MRVAFYAPMKAPDHPVPSGDRAVARLLLAALAYAGHEADSISRFRTWQAGPDPQRQARLAELGAKLAARLVARVRRQPPDRRPQVWLTYHLYYKAPDFIGPAVAEALGVPYVLVEASLAHKRAGGPWDIGHRAAVWAVKRAAEVVQINPEDAECLPADSRQCLLPPFVDGRPYRAAQVQRSALRAAWARRLTLDAEMPWIVAVAMMRAGDKLASYRLLAEALAKTSDLPWQLLLIGDGKARPAVEAAFSDALGAGYDRVRFLGLLPEGGVAEPLAACDLFAWPAVNEAYGMALLEAQAAGLPAVAGRRPGVAAVVADGETGLLADAAEPGAFAAALQRALQDADLRRAMGARASQKSREHHDLAGAAERLAAVLEAAVEAGPCAS